MVRIERMAKQVLRMNRRDWMAGVGAASLGVLMPGRSLAQGRPAIAIKAQQGGLGIRNGGPETPIWMLESPELRFRRGDDLQVEFANDLTVPAGLDWRGIGGVPAIEPLISRRLLAPSGWENIRIPLRHAGTFLCDMILLDLQSQRQARGRPLVVAENEPVSADRDEVLLVEEWRLRADGTAVVPGADPAETTTFYTLNGKASVDVSTRSNERLRLRFINGSRRSIIALKLESVDVTVMAIDSQPSEPFLARNGAIVLAPGSRVDAFVDVKAPPGSNLKILLHEGRQARTIGFLTVSSDSPVRAAPLPPPPPLPSNGLPAQLDLKNALRTDLALSGPEWIVTSDLAATPKPAFRAKPGRVVVLAVTNRAALPTVFRLHGHHFRLLDKLDDGWKPYWLDTLAFEPGQTQRIAFAAEHAGRWLIESIAADWAAPRFVRWYAVE
ncbi:multicopper oxidase family protein [Bradyrhizobium roseum]|uniref:multicopper oxidase family protein n=1 Tax=Bradyrhizobium roseum TaxID=3056648 RepID=UPI002630857B|nr:multicopper oxidase domain-containing protein [Bradyrhizobium roseus]WKA31558.1 multicopper oxidase domain-containing protein [Bradyrhizobium roseus]